MKISHVAIWSKDIEKQKNFYIKYFKATSNDQYHNPNKNFKSYFLSFNGETKLEIMEMPNIKECPHLDSEQLFGYCHIAIAVKDKEEVVSLTNKLRTDGYIVLGEPRTTGDGYFESVILDTDGNRVEITC